jgi:hypothetical protein
LAEDFASDPVALIADIDCTEPAAENLCERFNIEGFPTLMYGDPELPEEYDGGTFSYVVFVQRKKKCLEEGSYDKVTCWRFIVGWTSRLLPLSMFALLTLFSSFK